MYNSKEKEQHFKYVFSVFAFLCQYYIVQAEIRVATALCCGASDISDLDNKSKHYPAPANRFINIFFMPVTVMYTAVDLAWYIV